MEQYNIFFRRNYYFRIHKCQERLGSTCPQVFNQLLIGRVYTENLVLKLLHMLLSFDFRQQIQQS